MMRHMRNGRARRCGRRDDPRMKLHPNPPRMVTVVLAVALGVIGLSLAWPIAPAVSLLAPVADAAKGLGIAFDAQLGWLCLFASSALLVAGSLLPGI
jgi:hypothetical protein